MAKKKTQIVWEDIRTASFAHMQLSLAQEREKIAKQLYQMTIDAASWNDNSSGDGPKLNIVVDFTDDMLELAQPKTYTPRKETP